MSRYIDADKLISQVVKKKPEVAKARYTEGFNDAIMRVRSMIHSAPSADVVEIVRCKDCKYLTFSDCYGECGKARLGIVHPDDFCSHGERKEE